MDKLIDLQSVDLVYPIYSVKAQSLRNVMANFSVGGRLLKSGSDVIHVQALSGVNFTLHVGDRLAIIGHNGAGKTTLLKVIAGIYEPTKGRAVTNGRITSMIDISLGLDANLTGRENIVVMGRMRGMTTKQIMSKMEDIISFSELGSFIELPIKTLSSGMVSRLVFSVATTLDPDIMLFDEWLSTGDADFIQKAKARMEDLVGRSRGLVLATHSFDLAQSMCNKLLVLDGGAQQYFGPINGWDFERKTPVGTV